MSTDLRLTVVSTLAASLLLAACGAEPPARPVKSASTARAAAPAAIPDHAATGTLRDRSFTPESATLKEGILSLRSGADFFADLEVTLFLFLEDNEVVPEEQVWEVDCSSGWRGGMPHVHVAWREPGEKMPEYASTTCGYRLRLELGIEAPDGTIPGRIALNVPELGTQLAGTFEATVEGFRRKDGRVDLSQDDLDVAHHVAALWLATRTGAAVEVVDHALAWMHTEKPEGRPQAAFATYWWRPAAGGEERVAKLQFEKRENEWRVARELAPWQVADAHPVSPRGGLSFSFEHRAAQRFEREQRDAHGEAPIFVAEVVSGYNPKVGLAEVTVRYVRDDRSARDMSRVLGNRDAMPRVRYLFRTEADYPRYNEPDAWRLDGRLRDDQKVDFKAGRVIGADATKASSSLAMDAS